MKTNGLLALIILNAIGWITTGIIAWVCISTTGNAWWSLLILIPALCGYSYKKIDDENDII